MSTNVEVVKIKTHEIIKLRIENFSPKRIPKQTKKISKIQKNKIRKKLEDFYELSEGLNSRVTHAQEKFNHVMDTLIDESIRDENFSTSFEK